MIRRDKMAKCFFFPSPADGETVYSTICRFIERSGLPSGYTIHRLTGQRNIPSVLNPLTGYAGQISESMPYGHIWRNTMKIVRDHTTLPYFTYFLPEKDRIEWSLRQAKAKSSKPIAMALGLTQFPGNPTPAHPRYCPKCIEEQVRHNGFSYFKRHHQLPTVLVCTEHEEILCHGCSVCGPYPIKMRNCSMPGRCLCKTISHLPAISPTSDVKSLLWFARESEYMVNSAGTSHSAPQSVLMEEAIHKGFERRGVINYEKLAIGIESRFGKEALIDIGVNIWTNNQPAAWIQRLLKRSNINKKKPSILLLLVIGTLFESIDLFENWQGKKVPIVDVLAKKTFKLKDLRLPVEKNWKVTDIQKYYGAKYGVVIRELRQQRISMSLSNRMKKKLGVNLDKIREDLISGISKKEIEANYGCTEEIIILIELDDLSLINQHSQAVKSIIKAKHRQKLIDFLQKHPQASRITIMKQITGSYDYFLASDREWFYAQIPAKKAKQGILRKYRVDWESVDKYKSEELSKLIVVLYNESERPYWVTKCRLLRQIGLLSKYFFAPCKFPKVKAILDSKIETYEEFIIRRITWAVKHYKEKYIGLSLTRLRRFAGINAQHLRDHKQLVYDLAMKFEIEFTEQSFFSAAINTGNINCNVVDGFE